MAHWKDPGAKLSGSGEMAIKSALLSIGGSVAIISLMSGPALAGGPSNCANIGAGHGQSQNCNTSISYVRTPTGYSGPTTIENRTPYDYFDSVHFQRSPHVSITRIHSLEPGVGLTDSPVGFTAGCHPESTTYCRSGQSSQATRTVSSAPTYSPAPVMAAPTPMPPRIVATGGGFDPSKFTPRIYGDPYTITPGIAYLPTTVVDRNPYRAQAVLDAGPGGVTPALTGMPIGPLPTPRPYSPRPYSANAGAVQPRMMQAPAVQRPVMQAPMMMRPQVQPQMVQPRMMQQPMMQRPMMRPSIPTGYPGAAGAPYQMSNGRYGSRVGADGTYWDKVSGPTQYGNTVASQVICKRRLPQPGPNVYPPAPCNGHAAHQGGQSSRY